MVQLMPLPPLHHWLSLRLHLCLHLHLMRTVSATFSSVAESCGDQLWASDSTFDDRAEPLKHRTTRSERLENSVEETRVTKVHQAWTDCYKQTTPQTL